MVRVAIMTVAHSLLPLAALAVLASVTVTDLRRMIIPNRTVLPAAAAALVFNVAFGAGPRWEYPLAGFLSFLFLLVPAVIRPGAMGMGDVNSWPSSWARCSAATWRWPCLSP